MPTVNFSGAGSGIDWNMIIDATIQAKRRAVITPIQNWKDSWESKVSAYDTLRSNLQDLLDAVRAMDTPAEMRAYTVESTDSDAVDATVTTNATPGSHTVLVNQLAGAESEVHAGLDEAETVVNNSGGELVFAYTYAGTAVSLYVPDGTTLEGLKDLINDHSGNPGVVASVLDDGGDGPTSHHLVLTGRDTGADHTITVDPALTTLQGEWAVVTKDGNAGDTRIEVDDVSIFQAYQAVLVDDDDSGPSYQVIDSIDAGNSELNFRSTLGADYKMADNAYVTPRGIGSGLAEAVGAGVSQIVVDDATHFQAGKTIVIADAAGDEQAVISSVDTETNTITLEAGLTNAYADTAYVTQIEGGRKFTFEDTDFTETQTAQDLQIRVDGYPASGWIQRASNTVSDVIPGVTLTITDTTGGSPVTVTVNEDRDGVREKIEAFVAAFNTVKTYLNEATAYDADAGEAGELNASYAAEVTDQILRSLVMSPAPGFDADADAYTMLAQIGITSVGLGEDTATLGTLEIDDETLDAALAENYEDVIRLFSEDFEGYSSSTDLTYYQSSRSLTTPGKYDVEVDFDGSGNITGARMKLTSESTWRTASVDGNYVIGSEDGGENGLWVRAEWDGASSTQSAVVRVTRGVAGAMSASLADLLDTTDGLLHTIDDNYADIIDQIQDRIDAEEARLDQLRERLLAQYGRLEQLLVQLQGQQNWAANLASSMNRITS